MIRLLVVLAALSGAVIASAASNGAKRLDKRFEEQDLVLNGGWQEFQFGPTNSTVREAFAFSSATSSILQITDLYCNGDIFAVFDNGEPLGMTSFVQASPHCELNTTNPDVAFNDGNFSHGVFNLAAGSHKITIRVVESPYKAGAGAIRVDSLLVGCSSQGVSQLTIISTPVPYHMAKQACTTFKLHLADIDIINFSDATLVAFQCAGAFEQVWVRSWNRDTYQGECLALHTANSAPGGSINVPGSCLKGRPVLCQSGPNFLEPPKASTGGSKKPTDKQIFAINQ